MWQPMANRAILKRMFKSAVFPSKNCSSETFSKFQTNMIFETFLQ